MKKTIAYFVFLLISFCSFSQEAFNYVEEVNRSANIPNTPGAQAFSQYGNVPVNLYVGKPNVSVPLYTYSGREMNLPISLTYDMDARKVEDIATSVGMGWNLNLGGRISRIVNGLPDMYKDLEGHAYESLLNDTGLKSEFLALKDKFYNHHTQNNQTMEFDNVGDAKAYFKFLNDAQIGKSDIHLDDYSLSVMGLNDHVIIHDIDLSAKAIENQRTIVTYEFDSTNNPEYIEEWHVTDDSGTQFFFEISEETKSRNYDDIGNNGTTAAYKVVYNSSWLLTKIISPNGKDTYLFEYVFDSSTDPDGFWDAETYTNSIHATNYGATPIAVEHTPNTWYKHKQQFLKTVKHNGNIIVDITYKERDDLDVANSAIKSIDIKSPFDNSIVKHFEFTHTYFGTLVNDTIDEFRLKLDEIKVAGQGYNGSPSYDFKQEYSFDYENSSAMPSRRSFARDVQGFFNGEYGNDGIYQGNGVYKAFLYPKKVLPVGGQNVYMEGANRDFSLSDAKIGILNKITYPTGGFTEFEYEQHKETMYETNTSTIVKALANAEETNIPDTTQCGVCCQAETDPLEAAKVSTDSFSVSLAQNTSYKISYKVAHPTIGNDYKAYIVGPLNPSESYTYEDICLGNVNPLYTYEGANDQIDNYQNIPTGFYQIFVYNPDQDAAYSCDETGECSAVSLIVSFTETTGQTPVDVFYPGLRVKSITDYTDVNAAATKKIYEYGQLNENYPLVLEYQTTETYLLANNSSPQYQTVYHRLGKPIMGSEPYITYGDVAEKQVSPLTNTAALGLIAHEFFNTGASGQVPGGAPPFLTDYTSNKVKGNLKTNSVIDATGNLESKSTNFYDTVFGDYYTSIGIGDIPSNSVNFIKLETRPNNKISFSFVQGEIDNNVGGLVPPYNCGADCLEDNANSRILPTYVYTNKQHITASENESTQYYNNIELTQEGRTIYDPGVNYLMRKSYSTTSEDDKEIITELTYPEDISNEQSMNDLIIANRIAQPVEVKTRQKEGVQAEELMQRQKTWFTSANGQILPQKMQTAKGSNAYEDRISYKYDATGNPEEISRPGGLPTSFIWGYNEEVPVAKIEGIAHSAILSPIINDIHAATATGSFNLQNLLDAFDDLRLAFPTALIATYTYEPLIGLSTVTDTKGYTMSYHYDDENRLLFVKDQDGNVLSEQEYNLRNQ